MQSWLSSMRSKPVTWLLHLALATIVVGACVTHFFGEQGEIHLRADKAQSLNIKHSTLNIQHSSISLFLWDFQIVNDDAGNPVDFISELRMLDRGEKSKEQGLTIDEGIVRMNKPLKYHGWRFCQSDYDSDMQGVVLSYNYDPWGIGLTYTGYALLLIAMLAFFFQPRTYFRGLFHRLTTQWSRSKAISLLTALAVLIVVLAIIMTRVVTPKPPLQPVLQTPLLGIHVSVIMLAYTLFAVIMINGIIALIHIARCKINDKMAKCTNKSYMVNDQMVNRLMTLSQILLYPALFCLTAGIFIGAVWANMSWGRYWGWDPKETWALITMLVYAVQLHWPWIKNKSQITNVKSQIVYHVLSVINFLFVLFTYFGVSYLLGGLHSYA